MSSAQPMQSIPPKKGQRIDLMLGLILACTFLEFARPTVWTFNLPTLAIGFLLYRWLISKRRQLNPQSICFLCFLVVMTIHIPFAENYFFAFWTTFLLATTIALCIPIMHFVDSVRRFEMVVACFMLAALYVGVYAIGHDGWGPLGAAAGQDQNYVALAMAVALPFPYFYLFLTKGAAKKILLAGMTIAYVLAIVVGFSRGGFVGLCAVAVYCWIRSPGKLLGLGVVLLVGAVVWGWAPDTYWDEMGTISDTSEGGTADHRLELWKIAVREFKANPIAGVGPANFRWEAGKYQSADQWEKFDRSLEGSHFTHSLYFELLSEMGTIGVLLFSAICFYNLRDLQAVARMKQVPGVDPANVRRARYLAKAVGGALIGFLVSSVFLSTLYDAGFWFLTALTVALRQSVLGPSLRPARTKRPLPHSRPPQGPTAPRRQAARSVRV
jgi:O-antigen ligase